MEHLIRKERKKEVEKERKRKAKRERVTCKLDEGGSSKIGKKRPSLRTEERERRWRRAVPSRPEIVRVAQSSGNAAKNLDRGCGGGVGTDRSLGNPVIRRPEKCDRH